MARDSFGGLSTPISSSLSQAFMAAPSPASPRTGLPPCHLRGRPHRSGGGDRGAKPDEKRPRSKGTSGKARLRPKNLETCCRQEAARTRLARSQSCIRLPKECPHAHSARGARGLQAVQKGKRPLAR